MNFIEWHIGDYMRDTAHLSMLEDAAYRRLLDRYYTSEQPLPADVRACCKLARASTAAERSAVAAVLEEFFVLGSDGHRQTRADAEIARYQDKQRKARASAAVSVQVRQERAGQSNAHIRAARMESARLKGTHTREEWVALRHVCGYRCVKCSAEGHQDRDHILPVYQGGSDSISNIQPLCARCNAAKGPEAIDYRPSDWRANVERTLNERPPAFERALNERSTDAQHRAPVPSPQSPDTNTKDQREHTREVCARALVEVRKSFPKADESADLVALVEHGATPGEIGAIAAEAAMKGKGWPWVVTTVVGRRQDAAKLVLAPKPETPWHETRSGIVAKGVELGIGEWSEAEWHAGRAPQWPTYQAKVYAAAGYEPPRMSA